MKSESIRAINAEGSLCCATGCQPASHQACCEVRQVEEAFPLSLSIWTTGDENILDSACE